MGQNAILITGAAGFIGWNLARYFSANGNAVIAGYNRMRPEEQSPMRWEHLPLSSGGLTADIFGLAPSLILHCAAIPGTAACDSDRKHAFKINVVATRRIAEAAERLQIPMVYCSTDLVFDGVRGWYNEEDTPNPETYYAETKLLGEQETMSECSRSFVLRLALTYGLAHDGFGGFLRWTDEALIAGRALQLFDNQYRSVLYVNDIAEIISRLMKKENAYGIYHLGGAERLSRFDIGKIFAERFHNSVSSIVPVRLNRGKGFGDIDDTSLITKKVITATGIHPVGFSKGVEILYNLCRRTKPVL